MSGAPDSEGGRPGRNIDAILESISDGFAILDNNWRFTYVNMAAERIWRRRAIDLIGRTPFDAIKVDDENPFHPNYMESKRTGEPAFLSGYSRFLAAWLEVRGYPRADGYTIFFRDVTDERRAHLALIESRRALDAALRLNQRIFETTLDLILVVDRQGTIAQVSPSVETILGYRPVDLVGRSAAGYIHVDDLDPTRNEMRMARRGRAMRHFQTRYVHKDGRAVPLAWTGIWSDAEQQHFFIGRDMTDRIEAEERLRRAQRLESIGQLTGGIAHDFNNLLTVIIGNLDLLQEQVRGDAMATRLSESALAAALRGASLTRQLLAFARRQSLDAKVVDVNERVIGSIDILRRTLGEDIEIMTELTQKLWPAMVDPVQLDSAIINLAINARDAMPNGGHLIIETANKTIDASYVAANTDAAPGDYVMLAVSDTGTGMTPEVIARAFEPFFTTKPTGKGTGLGLSMVYGFARQSRGHVQLYSEVGRGTSVRLYLPRAPGAPEAATVPSVTSMPRAKTGERILAVEDNPDVRRIVVAQLRELGYDVIEAANGDAAMAAIERGETVNLVFSDVVMPGGMSGYELARAIRTRRPGLRILLTSGFPKTPRDEAVTPEPLLVKPYRKADLALRIRAALDS